MSTKPQPPRGTKDYLAEDQRLWRHVADTARDVSETYGFDEVSTPIFEQTSVFARSIGEATDVVSKEMYSFVAREGGDSLTLRPENTAGVARAFLTHGLSQSVPVRQFYAGPMFRYERPQKGRYRQFHQIGVELIGAPEPGADVDVIACGADVLDALGLLDRTKLRLNTLGDTESRGAFRQALVDYFNGHLDKLSDESKDRLTKNPLRILDSKNKDDQALLPAAPRFSDYLNDASKDFFGDVCKGLDALGITYQLDDTLVRGLDYYCHTAFEFETDALGAQSGVLGGGRYDGLIETLGGPPTPGVGWAAGIERMMLLCEQSPSVTPTLALVPLGDAAEAKALVLSRALRQQGLKVDLSYGGNMKKRIRRADRVGADFAAILGEDELGQGVVQLKDFSKGEQETVAIDQLADKLAKLRGAKR